MQLKEAEAEERPFWVAKLDSEFTMLGRLHLRLHGS